MNTTFPSTHKVARDLTRLAPKIDAVAKAFQEFGDACTKAFAPMKATFLEAVIIPNYLKTHNRLPGSTRTKRLRKKRETRLLQYQWRS